MSVPIVETMRLSGSEAIEFATSLFRPSKSIVENRRKVMDLIEHSVVISRLSNGFDANIADLDLAFLNDNTSKVLSIDDIYKIDIQFNLISSESSINQSVIAVRRNDSFCGSIDTSYITWAA